MPGPVAFVLKGWPRLSETFIAQEIRGLERRGLDILLYSMRRPTDPYLHPVHREVVAPVRYLPEYLHEAPGRVLRAWWTTRRALGYRAALKLFLRDLRRDPTRNRLRRFGQAMVLAAELPPEVGWLHAHFLHTPASVTRYAAAILGLPWSGSAHAKDVWTTPEWEKREKLADCRWLVTCTEVNATHLGALAPVPDRVELLYHGLDLLRFPPFVGRRPKRNGDDPEDPVVLLCVCRAVEKKGLRLLLDALALLPDDLAWRLVHVGGGPLLEGLRARAAELGIAGRIDWTGPQPQDVVLRKYREADLFVLPCRIAGDGDRDGLPNVLMEAQSQGLACVSTEVSAIPELIVDGETGILVPPDEAGVLSRALHRLIRHPDYRSRLGTAGAWQVRRAFSVERGLDRLARRFGIDPRASDPTRGGPNPGDPCASPSTRR